MNLWQPVTLVESEKFGDYRLDSYSDGWCYLYNLCVLWLSFPSKAAAYEYCFGLSHAEACSVLGSTPDILSAFDVDDSLF